MSSPRTLDDAVGSALPDGPLPDTIDPELRRAIARTWIEHASSERAEAGSMAHVAAIVLERSGPGDLHWIAARAASDELRHAAICVRVARAYDASLDVLPPARQFVSVPVSVPSEHHGTLRVLAQCCIQETLAAAYLERAHASSVEPLPRAALRLLFSDEIDHGRIGYAFASLIDDRARRAVRAPLAAMLETCAATWHARARALPDIEAPEHGVLSRATIVETIDRAIEELVLPGLCEVGLAS
jgi:hypothetical protein